MQTIQTLTPAQLRDLEGELNAERVRLERSIAAMAATDGVGDGESDDGDVRLQVHERHQAIGAALRRLDEGVYGLCTGCHEPIPYGRLLVMPESERCVACGAAA